MDIVKIVQDLAAGGLVTLLIAIGVAGWYRVWVWGYIYEDMKKEKDKQIEEERLEKEEYKAMVFAARHLTERTMTVADKLVTKAHHES